MVKHQGQILEYAVRKAGYNLSELAAQLGVNRRNLYNWFLLPKLKTDVIYRIGKIIRHDFSADFPEILTYSEPGLELRPKIQESILTDDIWKDKYISLLERYNQHLITANKRDDDSIVFP